MEHSIPLPLLPTAAELPDSDDTPVDNELQNLLPNLLLAILSVVWSDRQDWFFGVDMGIYYLPTAPRKPVIPDGFLSLGVERRRRPGGRPSYVLWEENWTPPILVLEVVSHTYGGEYDIKLGKYLDLGVLYYVIYNPDYWQRDGHAAFEVYQRVDDEFLLQSQEQSQEQPQERFWLPELQLAIGVAPGIYKGWERDWLFWFDQAGHRFPSPDERAEQAEQRAEQAEQALQDLQNKLKQRGIDPDSL